MNTWPAKAWIEALDLQPHPEGGYFREVYRSAGSIPAAVLPSGFQGAIAPTVRVFTFCSPPRPVRDCTALPVMNCGTFTRAVA